MGAAFLKAPAVTAGPRPICWKIIYKTIDEARAALKSCQDKRGQKDVERRYYQCKTCRLWHLTSHRGDDGDMTRLANKRRGR